MKIKFKHNSQSKNKDNYFEPGSEPKLHCNLNYNPNQSDSELNQIFSCKLSSKTLH